jgi:cellulose synthase/poly-beta-1,6-N-acetylglucosamine synthase-like glycosyltransferase
MIVLYAVMFALLFNWCVKLQLLAITQKDKNISIISTVVSVLVSILLFILINVSV